MTEAELTAYMIKNDAALAETRTAIAKLNDKPAVNILEEVDKVLAAKQATLQTVDLNEPGRGKSWMPSFNVKGIDVLQVGVGFGVSVLATELIDGFLPAKTGATPAEIKTNGYVRGGIKMAGGVASFKWGRKVFGETGKNVVAALVFYDGLRDVVPFDTWIKENIANKITKNTPAAGLTQGRPTVPGSPAPQPSRSYLEI